MLNLNLKSKLLLFLLSSKLYAVTPNFKIGKLVLL